MKENLHDYLPRTYFKNLISNLIPFYVCKDILCVQRYTNLNFDILITCAIAKLENGAVASFLSLLVRNKILRIGTK